MGLSARSVVRAGLVLALVALGPALARAQEPEPDPDPEHDDPRWEEGMAQRDAGVAWRELEEGGDPDGFAKCAQTFVDLFNTYVDHPKAATLLWIAADCYDADYQVGAAVVTRGALISRFPHSVHAQDTLHYLAETYEAVARYEDAAERYEQFAEWFPKDDRSARALQNAYLFRLGLSQDDAALADLREYEAIYKKKDISKAAKIFWSGHELQPSAAKRRAHAEQYLETYKTRGGVDRAIVAEAVIAQIDWRRSCREPLLHDSCISIERDDIHPSTVALEAALARLETKAVKAPAPGKSRYRAPKRCGTARHAIITVHKRSSKYAEAAQSRFKKIVKMIGRGNKIDIPEDDRARHAAFKDAWGMAMVYQIDADYEDYLRMELPGDLDLYYPERPDAPHDSPEYRAYKEQLRRAEDSQKRMYEHFAAKMKRNTELMKAYAEVKQTGSPAWILAAAAQTAMALQAFADQLRRAKIPRSLRGQVRIEAYCDALADQAVPLADQALNAWEYCLNRSTEFQYYTPQSRMCEAELQRARSNYYPATVELFGEPHAASNRMERSSLVDDHTRRRWLTPADLGEGL